MELRLVIGENLDNESLELNEQALAKIEELFDCGEGKLCFKRRGNEMIVTYEDDDVANGG